jgi:DNA-binding transcriptional LysR family regulator
VDLRLLRVFRTVVDSGGYSAAEIVLNKSKSAISLDISHLEQRLGIRLCTRGRSGFALTNEGHIVYLATLQLFSDIEKFRDRVSAAMRCLTGTASLLLVDNMVSVAGPLLAEALAKFSRQHPKVQLRVESATVSSVERGVLEGEVDLGISVASRPLATLEMIPLFREELRLYCGRDHPLYSAQTPTPQEVIEHQLIKPSIAGDPAFAKLVGSFSIANQASSLDTRILFILGGIHLGFLPRHYAEPWLKRGEIREIIPEIFNGTNTFYLLLKKSARQTVAARELTQIILMSFQEAQEFGIIMKGDGGLP